MHSLSQTLKSDFDHYLNGTLRTREDRRTRSLIRSIAKSLIDIDFRVVLYFRISAYLWSRGFQFLALVLHYRLKSRFHVEIHPSVSIQRGLRLVHAFSIVIGAQARIGENVTIFGNVFLGKSRPDLNGSQMPTIGNRVILGAGCKILGRVSIPANRLVPANTVITLNKLAKNPDLLFELKCTTTGDAR